MLNPLDGNVARLVVDRIDNAIRADAHPIMMTLSHELHAIARARVDLQSIDCFGDSRTNGMVQA